MKCSHTRRKEILVTKSRWCPYLEDMIDVEEYETFEESTEEDIDLHRYKCTLCGKIGYYSNAAANFYKKGITSPGIKGLE